MVTPRSRLQTKRTQLSSKKIVKKNATAVIRRSGCLCNATSPGHNRQIEAVVEQINLCGSEKVDESHVEGTLPESMSPEEHLEEKTDQPVGGSKAKFAKKDLPNDSSSADLKYRRLYFDSKKKNEVLMKENHELSKDLAVALGKIEGLAESSRVCLALLGKLQDVLLVLNLGKAIETALNLSSRAVFHRCSSANAAADPEAIVRRRGKGKKN